MSRSESHTGSGDRHGPAAASAEQGQASVYACSCGAKYRVAKSGRYRCKHCGETIVVGGAAQDQSGEIRVKGGPALNLPQAVIIEGEQQAPLRDWRARSFMGDVLFSLLILIEPANLPRFAVIWFFNLLMMGFAFIATSVFNVTLVPFIPLGCLIFAIFCFGWLGSYYMRLIEDVAANDDELPETFMGGAYESIIRPLFMFVGTAFCLSFPMIIMSAVEQTFQVPLPRSWYWAAAIVAVVMWPMSLLCVSMGGILVFARADLMVYSVFRTAGAYTVVWVLLGLVVGGAYGLVKLSGSAAGAAILGRHPLPAIAFSAFLLGYLSLIAMRVVGLYYRHFKHRFAWSWE